MGLLLPPKLPTVPVVAAFVLLSAFATWNHLEHSEHQTRMEQVVWSQVAKAAAETEVDNLWNPADKKADTTKHVAPPLPPVGSCSSPSERELCIPPDLDPTARHEGQAGGSMVQAGRIWFPTISKRIHGMDQIRYRVATPAHRAVQLRVLTSNVWAGTNFISEGYDFEGWPESFAPRAANMRAFFTQAAQDYDILLLQEVGIGSQEEELIMAALGSGFQLVQDRKVAVVFRKALLHLKRELNLGYPKNIPWVKESAAQVGRFGGVSAVLELLSDDGKVTGTEIVAASIHLPWQGTPEERQQGQCRRREIMSQWVAELDELVDEQHAVAALVGGDFNDHFHPVEAALEKGWRDCWWDLRRVSPPTYPAFGGIDAYGYSYTERGSVTYDWILSNSGFRSVEAQVLSSRMIEASAVKQGEFPFFSDHLPVRAVYELLVGGD